MTVEPSPRVLVVSLGRRGGVTEYGWLMGRALCEQTPTAVVYSSFAENAHKWRSIECSALGVPTFRGLTGLLLSPFALRRFARIVRFARDFAPDVVYYPGGHAWKPLLDVLLPRATTVLTVHDPQLHPGERSAAWQLFDWLNHRRADGYVLLNSAQRDAFIAKRGVSAERVNVIPHGVFDDYVSDDAMRGESGASVSVPSFESGRFALFVGRLMPYKGLDVLLEAYDTLAEPGPLVIAGSGNLTPRECALLRKLANRPVRFVNSWMPDSEMAALVGACRFVVLPYRSATQSGVIPLAYAFGKPAVASNTAGLTEQVIDGKTGLLVPPCDVPALAAALAALYAMSDKDYEFMSAACAELARTEWSWAALSGRLIDFVSRLHADT